MNTLQVKDKEYEYTDEISVKQFQSIVNLMANINEIVAEPNMTAGKLVGYLSTKNKLSHLVGILIDAPPEEIETFPINKAVEVCNNFFYTNGFWLMISNQFSMPSEVSEMLTKDTPNQTPTTLSANSEKSRTDGKVKKLKVATSTE